MNNKMDVCLLRNCISFLIYNVQEKEIEVNSLKGYYSIKNKTFKEYEEISKKLSLENFVLINAEEEPYIKKNDIEFLGFDLHYTFYTDSIISFCYDEPTKKLYIDTIGDSIALYDISEELYKRIYNDAMKDGLFTIKILDEEKYNIPDFSKIKKLGKKVNKEE